MAAMADQHKCNVPVADVLIEGGRTGSLLVIGSAARRQISSPWPRARRAAGHTVSCPLLYGHGGSRALLGATTWPLVRLGERGAGRNS